MTLLNPIAAWLLLLLPLLVLLYFLRLRRPRKQVSSTLLWRRVLNDLRVNTPFQKLRKALLLLLQIAVLCALIAAAVRPLQQLSTSPRESVIVLIDRSASMQTKHPGGSRFSQANRHLARLIDELGARSEMAIVSFCNETTIEQSFTNDRRRLATAAAGLSCGDAAGKFTKAFELTASLVIARPQTRVVLISDTTPSTVAGELPFELEFIKVGEPIANLAITGVEARRLPDAPDQVEIHISIRRYGKASPALVVVSQKEKRLAAQLPKFQDSDTASLIIPVTLPDAAILSINVTSDDALSVDNQAWCIVNKPEKFLIRLNGLDADHLFFEAALKATPFAETVSASSTENAHAVIRAVENLPPNPPAAHELLILKEQMQPIASTDVIDWNPQTNLTRHLDLSELRVSKRSNAPIPESYHRLIRANNGPLVSSQRASQFHRTVLSFSPSQSNWPLQPSFPLFLHNWISLLQRTAHKSATTNTRVGERHSFARSIQSGTSMSIKGPAAEAKLTAVAGRPMASHLNRVGVYFARIGDDANHPIAVNLADADESDTMNQSKLIATTTPVATVPPRTPASKEWTIACLAFAFVALCIEWCAYHRLLDFPQRQPTSPS